jgi:hypothetical protein
MNVKLKKANVGFLKKNKKPGNHLPGFFNIGSCNLAVHADQELCIVFGPSHTLK